MLNALTILRFLSRALHLHGKSKCIGLHRCMCARVSRFFEQQHAGSAA